MKFQKINYAIIGRFENGSKYGIITRREVSGYTADGMDGIAFRKRNGFWYVDHISTGMGVVTVGCKTREAAAKEYADHYKAMIDSKPAEYFKNAVETFENAPLESDVAAWEIVNFCTARNYRFDRVTDAARRAGLITKKADDVSYLDGGNINIIGAPEALEQIREMIREWAERDAEKDAAETVQDERPENISNETPETEHAPVYAFSETALTCNGVTFPAEYNISSSGSVLVFAIVGTKVDGRKEKQKIVFTADHPDYAAALAAAGGKIEKPAADPVQEPENAAESFENIPVIDTTTGETITENAAELIADQESAEPVQETPAPDQKAARGAVPEKTFIGQEIKGHGWRIFFDGETTRTRVIFTGIPNNAATEAVKNAGFYYSPNMKSWNKKLTFKAYRAAQALATELSRICTDAA